MQENPLFGSLLFYHPGAVRLDQWCSSGYENCCSWYCRGFVWWTHSCFVCWWVASLSYQILPLHSHSCFAQSCYEKTVFILPFPTLPHPIYSCFSLHPCLFQPSNAFSFHFLRFYTLGNDPLTFDIVRHFDFCIFICAEQLSGQNLGQLTEVTQSVNVQKQKLDQLITIVNELLGGKGTEKWSVDCTLFI